MSGKHQRYARLGEQIDHLIRALALAKNWRMGRAVAEVARHTGYAEATIHRWRQGRLRPPDETLEILARLGKDEAGLDRIWGDSLLQAARYLGASHLVNEIWGAKEILAVPHNLPTPAHTIFFGRQAEMARLMELLSPDHGAHLITVDGIGGVGKTTLTLEAACRCLRASTGEAPNPRAPTFEAIIFVSAKQQYLTPHGILPRHQSQRTLHDIFREIAYALDRQEIIRTSPDEQLIRIRNALARQRTLLIVDNLETIEEQQDVMAFLYDLPLQVKTIITTRERALFSPIRLVQLPEAEGLQLVHREAQDKGVHLDDEQALALYRRTGGVPAAMVYAVGQIASGHSVAAVLARVAQAGGDVACFCFQSSVAPMRGKSVHLLLMAIAMFPKRPLREAVIHVAGLRRVDPLAADEGLAQLQRLSLVSQREGRYSMLPLTREYALAELSAHPNFECEARERWVEWYLNLSKAHGGLDWQEWHIQYDRLEEEWENILAVLTWCAAEERYEDVVSLWKNVGGFSNIYGHWDDKIRWQEWLVHAAERRGDWPRVVDGLQAIGWQMILKGDFAASQNVLSRALSFQELVTPKEQMKLFRDLGYLCICRREVKEAFEWLARAHQAFQHGDQEDSERKRDEIGLAYRKAFAHFGEHSYDEADNLYRYVLEQSRAIGWQRGVNHAQNWLADIAILRGNLAEAAHLLQTGLPVAERNKDRQRIASYKLSFARLEQKRGNRAEARRWTEAALDDFDRLGMQSKIEEMRELMQVLDVSQV